ncbi:CCA tRNA nucleotidyltransferase [Caenispirillum bisanense]|uniref:Poly(A) polymerase n=1 Tax=Caenispirillum bisanense TaxID=414052 RepID=A0A286GKK8_9PROT|nr:CCA tRNA nucleotidyltransferase [Caenispirillum bisanense]SOD96068.1 poly(A) polymerase [Caenispirillum bisanense]
MATEHDTTIRLIPATGAGGARTAVGQLSPQPWMRDARTAAVIAALSAGGAEVRFVGGCVRDALLHRAVKDVDIATPETPDVVIRRLEDAGLRAVPTGLDHGTVTAVADGMSFEVTTLRRDVATDGRHAEVAFTDSFREDAARRDFTMNALSATPDGAVYDYFDGLADLAARKVRFVGRPQQRIREDYLRILRFFRFHAHYGAGAPDHEALKACGMEAAGLARLSGERVRDELLKILAAPQPAEALLEMRGERVLEQVLPEAVHIGRLRTLAWIETAGLRREWLTPDPLRRLAAVVENDRPAVLALAERLRLSNDQRDRLADLAAPAAGSPEPEPALDDAGLRRLAYGLGNARLRDRALVLWAAERVAQGHPDSRRTGLWIRLLDFAAEWTPPTLPLQGRDVLADLGVPPGPQVGELLRRAEALWLAEDFRPDRADLLRRLRETGPAGGAG